MNLTCRTSLEFTLEILLVMMSVIIRSVCDAITCQREMSHGIMSVPQSYPSNEKTCQPPIGLWLIHIKTWIILHRFGVFEATPVVPIKSCYYSELRNGMTIY